MITLPDFLLARPDLLSSLVDIPGDLLASQFSRGQRQLFGRIMPMSTDALSDVLSAVRLSGSVFFDVTAKSPWVAEAPPAAQRSPVGVMLPNKPGCGLSPNDLTGLF
jgi:hypothetical protein